MEELQPAEICSSKAARGLADYYFRKGESEHVAVIETALTADTQLTEDILAATGKTSGWGRNCLEYLALQGRAERVVVPVEPYSIFGKRCSFRYGWKLPT